MDKYSREVLELCSLLVAAKSYSGDENAAAEILAEYMRDHDFDDICTDKYGNVIGKISGNQKGPKILFDGHLDTVPA